MWLVAGFAGLGFLIGSLVGLSAHSVVTPVISLAFAFAGGSVVPFLGKLDSNDRRLAGQAICALSLTCVFGVYSGIGISEWRVLSPKDVQSKLVTPGTPGNAVAVRQSEPRSLANKYLNSASVDQIDAIDVLYRNKKISASEAYEKLYHSLTATVQDTSAKP